MKKMNNEIDNDINEMKLMNDNNDNDDDKEIMKMIMK